MFDAITTALREIVDTSPHKHAQITFACTTEELALSVGPRLNLVHLTQLATALRIVQASTSTRATTGLCFQIQCTLESVSSRVIRRGHPIMQVLLFSYLSWDLWSGDFTYPVPAPYGHVRAYNLAEMEGTMYVGLYGQTRKALLDHMIAWLDKLIARVNVLQSMEPTITFEVL